MEACKDSRANQERSCFALDLLHARSLHLPGLQVQLDHLNLHLLRVLVDLAAQEAQELLSHALFLALFLLRVQVQVLGLFLLRVQVLVQPPALGHPKMVVRLTSLAKRRTFCSRHRARNDPCMLPSTDNGLCHWLEGAHSRRSLFGWSRSSKRSQWI